MSSKKIVVLGAMLCACGMITSQATSQQKTGEDGGQPAMSEEDAKVMAAWAALAQPGEHHQFLNHFVGNWNITTRIYIGGPGSPPMVSSGTSEISWVLGKRFLMERMKSKMMGMWYEGMGMTGYDNYRNMYVGSWADSMGTQMLSTKGARNASSNRLTLYGEMDEPMLKVVGRAVKYVTEIINDKKHVFTIIDLHAGDDHKVLEITYTRP